MYDAVCTHNTTGFVCNMCVVPTMHFALYTQLEYIPTIPLHPEEALYTQSQYTPTMHFAVYTKCIYTPTIYSNYTANRNIRPQCNRLCLERVYRSCTVPCFLGSLFLENNGGKGDAHHIEIRRAIAEVPIRT